jgi:hypothetical protein
MIGAGMNPNIEKTTSVKPTAMDLSFFSIDL